MRYLNNTTLLLFIMTITITLNLKISDSKGASSKPPQKGFTPDELVVMFKDSATLADIEQIEKLNQLELIDELEAEEKLFNMELRLYKAPSNKPINIVMDNLLKESRIRYVDYHVIVDSSKTDINDESELSEDLSDNIPSTDLTDSGLKKL